MKMLKLVEDEGFIYQLHEERAVSLREMLVHCPTLPLVVSHLGMGWEWIKEKLLLAGEFPNMYLDICGWGHERIGVIERGRRYGLGRSNPLRQRLFH